MSSGNNSGAELGHVPETSTVHWGGGYEIRHAKLKIAERGKGDPLTFGLEEITDPPPPPVAKLDAYLRQLAGVAMIQSRGEPLSPYDIDVRKQSWVIFELDRGVPNWRFFGRGLTKKSQTDGSEFGLKYVLKDGVARYGDIPDDEECRLLVVAIARRGSQDHQYFNLHVEFVQGSGAADDPVKRLKVIFDPDVGNNGGFYPPPP